MRPAVLLTAGLLLSTLPGTARAAGEIQPGAYCPLPKPGEERACLEPARGRYGAFFDSLEEGAPRNDETARLEGEVESGGAEAPYLALSTLAYGYYRLAERAAARPDSDPEIAARLERWNALLARAYAGAENPDYKAAVRLAALDLSRNTPAIELQCQDAQGQQVACQSTEAVLRGIDAQGRRVGVRGALERILRRIAGGGEDS
jgi:hypothetical protein